MCDKAFNLNISPLRNSPKVNLVNTEILTIISFPLILSVKLLDFKTKLSQKYYLACAWGDYKIRTYFINLLLFISFSEKYYHACAWGDNLSLLFVSENDYQENIFL